MSSNTPRALGFFGATGGSVLAALTRTLKSDAPCRVNALARTPSKLKKLLSEHGVPQAAIDARLNIIAGDVKDLDAVRSTLVADSASATPTIVDTVVFGIGAYPVVRFHIYPFAMTDPTICTDAMATVLSALSALQDAQRSAGVTVQRPLIATVSTTGISTRQRDVPIAFVALYYWLLHVPHEDKRIMEKRLAESEQRFTVVRASLLTDGVARETQDVRVGWELPPAWEREDKGPGPAIGYTISRESVGNWLYETFVRSEAAQADQWAGRMVTLTE